MTFIKTGNLKRKALSVLLSLTLVINLLSPALLSGKAFAQEVSVGPEQAEQSTAPSDSAQAPSESQALTEDSSAVQEPAPAVEPSAEAAPEVSPSPTEEPTTPSEETVLEDPILIVESTAEPTLTPSEENSVTDTIINTEPALDAESAPVAEPSATPVPTPVPVWQDLNDKVFETEANVEVNKEYTAPQNDKVKITFNKLPEASGKLTIKEIKLSAEQIAQMGALSDTAYDITSSMQDGTFEYDLTLPLPENVESNEVEIKSAESVEDLDNAQKIEEPKEENSPDTITIKGLNHFTVFVITTPAPDTLQRVLINEIAPTAGTEWIELFNNGTAAVNLAAGTGWTIDSQTGTPQSLSALGAIDPAGRAVFNAPAGFLSDIAPETVTILNELGATIDTVTVSLTGPGAAVDHYPLASESVGRKTDGIAEWAIFTTPTKGTANLVNLTAGTGLADLGPIAPAGGLKAGFPTWYKDKNGLALDLMEAADAFGISDPVDPANPFSETVGFNAEGFWWSADAGIDVNMGEDPVTGDPITGGALLVLAMEAAFAGESAVNGEQSAFARVRIRVDAPVVGTYVVTYPFGQKTYQVTEAGTRAINDTIDIGCFAAPPATTCDEAGFATALQGPIGPFLTWNTFNMDPALSDPSLVNAANPNRRYIGNPAIEHQITGSQFERPDQPGVMANIFRVEGPDGSNLDGVGGDSIETELFTVSGRLADTSAPVITLFGASPVNAIQGSVYTDAGATALDDQGGNLTGSIIVVGLPVDTATLGAKTVTYTVTDGAGRTSVATRTVNVVAAGGVDTTAPVITLLGTSPVSITAGTPYIDAGATALDNVDGDISASIVTVNPVNTAVIGTYTVTYNVSDAALNPATQVTRTVNVGTDTVAPIITVTGSNPVNVLTGAPYADAGATATDNVNGNITANIVTTGLPINTAVVGVSTVTYTVTDAAGNTAVRTRTVNVANTLPAGIVEVGPVGPAGSSTEGFPTWYKDSNGLALDLLGATDGFGISDPVDPANPFSQQIGFNAEGFWWSGEAFINRPIGTRALLVMAQEAVFAGEAAVNGEQSVQNRLRYRIDGLVPGATYTITHPFGSIDEVADAAGVINVTDDIGCFDTGVGITCDQIASPNFSTALSGQVGPFLTWTTFNANPALTDILLTNPANPGRRYVGNPAIEHAVTGSPTGNNLFRVTGPNVGGPGVNSIETNLFLVSGRLADVTAPVITVNGLNPVDVTQNTVYADAGATALDDFDGIVAVIVTGLPVDTSVVGPKTVTYTVTDRAGNTATATRTVNVTGTDTVAPVIALLGVTPINVVANTSYVDAGATALDNLDGNITANIVTVNPVNTAIIGTYTVTYNVSDLVGNAAIEVTRTVNVTADTIAPVIAVLGTNPDSILAGAIYIDAGATALDNVDGDLTLAIITTGLPISTIVPGTFIVTYTVTDAAGNIATATRTVNVIAAPDVTAPVITMLGVTPVDVVVGTPYADAGATALDNVDGNITANIVNVNPVNTAIIGTYTVTYNVSDAAGNPAAHVTRTVNVVSVQGTASISGIVFQDTDADRIKDAGEPVLSGWTLFLDTNDNRILDAGETSTVSGAAGNYQFVGLLPGDYIVNEVIQANWAIRQPGNSGYAQTVVAGDNLTGKDFGNIATQTVGGQSQGGFATTTGTSLTQSIISLGDSVINVSSNGGTSKITVPADTIITESTGAVFDAAVLAASDPAGTLISGLGSGVVVNGKLQWGIPNLGLVFSNPITLEIFVGTALDGQTLDVLRSVDGTSNWTSNGIVAPGKCVIAAGICSFQATMASFYVAVTIPVTTTASSASSSDSSSSSSSSGDGRSDGLGCGSNDCSGNIVGGGASQGTASGPEQQLLAQAQGFAEEVLGVTEEVSAAEEQPGVIEESILGAQEQQPVAQAAAKKANNTLRNFALIGLLVIALLFSARLAWVNILKKNY